MKKTSNSIGRLALITLLTELREEFQEQPLDEANHLDNVRHTCTWDECCADDLYRNILAFIERKIATP